jgi:beta-mannanase
MDAAHELESAIGRRLDVISWYQHWAGWGTDFDPAWVDSVTSEARIPLLTWEPWAPGPVEQPEFRLASIRDGAFHAYVERWARDLRAYGRTIYLRPMHEMNGDWYPWGGTVNGNSPEDYVRAWRHLHDIFEREGATNVRWVWSPLTEDVPAVAGNTFERYYPGSAYVDVLALDGYNWGTSVDGLGGWRSFDEIFARAYRRITRLGPQPVWIAETASDVTGGDKSAWVRDMFVSVATYGRLRAIVWFNALKERDWRATSPAEVTAAF